MKSGEQAAQVGVGGQKIPEGRASREKKVGNFRAKLVIGM